MPKFIAENVSKEEFGELAATCSHTGWKSETNAAPAKFESYLDDDDDDRKSFFDRFVWWVCGVFVNKPCTSFFSVLGFILAIVSVVVASGNAGNSEESDRAWDMNSDFHTKQFDILGNLRDRTEVISVEYSTRQVALSGTSMIMTYDAANGKDIFTPANLQRMCEIEAVWFGSENYVDFCVVESACGSTPEGQLHSSCECAPPTTSAVGLFYGTSDMAWATSTTAPCPLLSEDVVSAKAQELYSALDTTAGLLKYGFYMGSDFNKKGFTSRSRSLLQVGGPLEGYTMTLDDDADQADQEKEYKMFFEEVQDNLIDMLGMEGSFMRSVFRDDSLVDGKIEVVWYAGILSGNIFEEMIAGDLIMVSFAVLFVLLWMNAHIGSFFLAGVGLFQIVMSLPFSRLFYSVIGGISYFSTLTSLAIFLVLGIGADDVFVLVDGWRQSEKDVPRYHAEDDESWWRRRLAASYSRTAQAVFNTSFTTAMAFISTAISPIMPISSFGIYATICIVVNYLFVISLTPSAIMIHQRYFGGFGPKGWCWVNTLCKKELEGETPQGAAESSANKQLEDNNSNLCGADPKASTLAPEEEVPTPPLVSACTSVGAPRQGENTGEATRKNVNLLTVNKDTDFISKVLITAFEYEPPTTDQAASWWPTPLRGVKVFALLSVLGCFATAATLTGLAANLALPEEAEQWFPKDHMVQRFVDSQAKFLQSEEGSYEKLSLVWGARPNIKRTNFDQWTPDENRGEARFDPNFDLANPEAFAAVKGACTQLQDKVCKAKGCKPYMKLVQPGSVVCAVEEFETWHVAIYGTNPADLFNDASTGASVFYERLLDFRSTTSPSSGSYASWEDLIGVIEGTFAYLVVTGDMTVELEEANVIKEDVLEVAKALLHEIAKPPSAHHVIQVSDVWVWYATNEAILQGMLTGLAIAFPVAFCTLIFATQNVVIALYAIVTIAAIVGSVLGAAERQGWALGIAESVSAVIVVGFSVDYTIHLGHMYDHAGHEGFASRTERARFAILKMGSTVFAGAITTAGSGAFMFPCQLVFFNKMAFLICLTILFSLLYSLCFFMPLLYIAGPSGNCGHISTLAPCLSNQRTESGEVRGAPELRGDADVASVDRDLPALKEVKLESFVDNL